MKNPRFIFFIVIVPILVYLPGLPGGFIYDDYVNILQNELICNSDLSLASAWEAMKSGIAGPLGRPLSMLSFYLNFKLSGFSPLGYKLFNIFIHAVNAVLVFIVVRRILNFLAGQGKLTGGKQGPEVTAFWISLLWTVHPINLTSVLYVVQRMTSMSATFTLLGFYCYQRIRETPPAVPWKIAGSLILVAVLGMLSALCKENGFLLFAYLLVLEYFVYRRVVTSNGERACLYSFYMITVVLPVCIAVYLLFFGDLLADYETKPFDLKQRLLTESRVLWFYISQILLPQAHLFSLYHDDFLLSTSLWKPLTTLTSIVGLIFLVFAGFGYARRFPWLGFGIVFFLCGHSMESTVFPLILVFEHRNYLPSLGLILIMVLSLRLLLNRTRTINSRLVLPAICILFATVTASHAYDWSNIVLLTERMVQRQPDSAWAHYEVGYIHMRLFETDPNPVFADTSKKAFEKSYLLSEGNKKLETAIVLTHVNSMYGKPLDQELLEYILNEIGSIKAGAFEVMALKKFVHCWIVKTCNTEYSTYQKIFTRLIGNPRLQGRLHDDVLYIYATYLVAVPGREAEALGIVRDIVSRNPDNLAYKVELISVLLTNEYNTEAYQMMDELTGHYGTKWEIIRK